MIKNTYGIRTIAITAEAKCFCPIGKDWYTNHFSIDFVPNELIPDYCEVDKFIEGNINGHHLIIEEAVNILHSYMKDTYAPSLVEVTSSVDDAKHCNVTVIK